MKNVLKCGALVAAFILLAVLPARADSGGMLTFDLSGPVSASWTMSADPTVTPVMPGIFGVNVSSFVVDGESEPGQLCFFSTGQGGGFNSAVDLTNLMGAQLYMGSPSHPTFFADTFDLMDMDNGEPEVLTVRQAPEPTTLLMLCSGLAAIGLKRKRQAAS